MGFDIEEIFGKDCQVFCERDPFNANNLVEGFISRKTTELYGALVITKVNSNAVLPQLIMATPKIHYPFSSRADGTRNYSFPSAKSIEIYIKLDGTNVLSYFYFDAKGNRFLSYKTRLRPFLSFSRFGNFYEMWNEVAKPFFPSIGGTMIDYSCNLSFELWGARNPHLIAYKEPLAFSLLFGVTNQGNILSPEDLGQTCLPKVPLLKTIAKDYVWHYEQTQKEIQDKLKKTEEGYYFGDEGAVWYLKTHDGKCLQFKCKPEEIEDIHFSAGAGGLSRNIVLATCWNALENEDIPSVEFVKRLLLEEFSSEVVEAKHNLIVSCIKFVVEENEFKQKVLEEYRNIGKNILLEKIEVMRHMSGKFSREKMGKVFAIIRNV